MVLKPMIRNNICMNAHPDGCRAMVDEQIEYIKKKSYSKKLGNVLVIGSSTGYGLATRITAAFGMGAATIGVAFERAASGSRTGTAGWYNTQQFQKRAGEAGLKIADFNGDAFSHDTRKEVIKKIKDDFGKIDLVVYSLASGVRQDPDTQELYRSALKPIGKSYTSKSVDSINGIITETTIEPANDDEIRATEKVMGGEDWILWIDALKDANVLNDGCISIAYSYIGPELTKPVYRDGTIGQAKEHIEATATQIKEKLKSLGGDAFVSVNKALVTRASAVIPVVPLYLAILFKIMKQKNIHEGCIEQIDRLFSDFLYSGDTVPVDEKGRIRIDDWEMREDVQAEVHEVWEKITTQNLLELADLEQYRKDFLKLHGFEVDGIDYSKDIQL